MYSQEGSRLQRSVTETIREAQYPESCTIASLQSIITRITIHTLLNFTKSHNPKPSTMSDTYKPSEHDGLKQDGTPDKRMEQTGMFYPTWCRSIPQLHRWITHCLSIHHQRLTLISRVRLRQGRPPRGRQAGRAQHWRHRQLREREHRPVRQLWRLCQGW